MNISNNKYLNFGKVAILFGGSSNERKISLQSGRLILKALLNKGIDAHLFDPSINSIFLLKEQAFTRVFNILHGGYGENGTVQGALNLIGIPYTGSNVLGSALGMDKLRTKLIWEKYNIPIPPYRAIFQNENYTQYQFVNLLIEELGGLPLFVKPASAGSSIGVFKVKDKKQLLSALRKIFLLDKISIVEKYIKGNEYSVTLINNKMLPIIYIKHTNEFYDYHAKYITNNTQYLLSSGLTILQTTQIEKLTRRAFKILSCTGWGRIDFIIDYNKNIFFLEINTIPGMTEHSISPIAAKAFGISYEDFVLMILQTSF